MRVYDLMTNRLVNPLGFSLGRPRLSYKVDQTQGKRQRWARVRIAAGQDMGELLYDSGAREEIDSLCFVPDIALRPRTRYWWDVEVEADNGDTARSAPAFFETGKMEEPWQAPWITAPIEGNTDLHRSFALKGPVASARVYAVGLGLFELYVNDGKAGDELLAPYDNAYDRWIQVETFDVGSMLQPGQNRLTVMLGDGWYKGRFGFRGQSGIYGDTQALRLELHVQYQDGSGEVLCSDEGWEATESRVRFANIYDGETYDGSFVPGKPVSAVIYHGLDQANLVDRLSPPVRVTERIAPRELITTPAGETVLDLGQEITGYLEFQCRAEAGAQVKLSYFEILQEGNYFRGNLRSAMQEQVYISNGMGADGTPIAVRPHFTFFGFRYVKLEGFTAPKLEDFTGCVVHSDIARTGRFACSNEKVNRLADNAVWGQRGNFLDVPTDCPQRDERMGWTGDAQAFSGTACFHMESAAFFAKYLYDMRMEQDKREGAVPHVVPMAGLEGQSSCAWADAATIIPWTVYLFYGDRELLRAQYSSMRDWVEWIYRTDEANGGTRLWQVGFHFADWLALDTKDGTAFGGTDPHYIASAYYYYSTSLVLKAARVLGYEEDARRYTQLLDEILEALHREYFTATGRLAQTTQTGYVCALFMGFAPQEHRERLAKLLGLEFRASYGKLRSGFVGTAYLCRTLSQCGMDELAYNLLLNEEYPGWLYEVNMGATTVWERWNSVLPDGRLSDLNMNSLNHYAYGAVMEWAFRDVAGLNPVEDAPGFRRALLQPRPDARLTHAGAVYDSAAGEYESCWTLENGTFRWTVKVPFGATATAVFPRADVDALAAAYPALKVRCLDGQATAELEAGKYCFEYTLGAPVGQIYDWKQPQ